MRGIIAIVTLAASIAGANPALADPVYVWRPSEGAKAGQILPEDAFTISTPPVPGGVDFRSEQYRQYPQHYTTRNVTLAIGDRLAVPVPALFQFGQCHVLNDTANRSPNGWVSISNSGSGGKWNVGIRAISSGRLELTLMCVTNTGGASEILYHEYLNITIS